MLGDEHFAEKFFQDFGSDCGGEARWVVHGIEFDDVGADDRAGQGVEVADGFGVVRPPGSQWETPGAKAGSSASMSKET